MAVQPAYQPLWDELLAFITRPEHAAELAAGRAEFVLHTGEVFEEDRSYEPRIAAFLDWFVFDRLLAPLGEPPVRAFAAQPGIDEARAGLFRVLSRTVHGMFEVRSSRRNRVSLVDLPTGARYDLRLKEPIEALVRGDLFEGRLVPFEGAHHFSPAFIFHPRIIRPLLTAELARQRRERTATPVQELVFTLSRMATRAEHYRNVKIEAIYDFSRPPPKVGPSLMKFDHESVARRLGRMLAKSAAPSEPAPILPAPA